MSTLSAGVHARLLSVRDVAHQLQFCPAQVRRLARLGHLRAVRLGRVLRFRQEAVERFVSASEQNEADLAAVRRTRREQFAKRSVCSQVVAGVP